MVLDEYERTLVEALEEENFFRSLATVIQTSSGDRKIPIVASKGEAKWIDEEAAYPESDDSFGQISISAYKVATMIKVSDELLNDNVFNLEAYISKEFGRRIGTKEEEAFLLEMARENRQESLMLQAELLMESRPQAQALRLTMLWIYFILCDPHIVKSGMDAQ